MSAEHYNSNARTPEEHFNNVLFQAANISGFLPDCRNAARAKAQALLESARMMVAAFEAEDCALRAAPPKEAA